MVCCILIHLNELFDFRAVLNKSDTVCQDQDTKISLYLIIMVMDFIRVHMKTFIDV